jgi:hypothetical protein
MSVYDGPNNNIGYSLMRGLPKPFPVDPNVLATYAGKYQSPDGGISTIRVDGTHIFLQIPNEPEHEQLAGSENRFYVQVSDLEITFYRNDSGKVDRMVGVADGVTYEAKKVP